MTGHDAHAAEPFLDTYLELVGDPAHWAFEITTSSAEALVIALVLTPLIRRWVTRHDRTVHTLPEPDYLEEYGGRWGASFVYEDDPGTVPTSPIGE